jgi:hypothetical protein
MKIGPNKHATRSDFLELALEKYQGDVVATFTNQAPLLGETKGKRL